MATPRKQRADAALSTQKKAGRERAALLGHYEAIKGSPALQDILAKCQGFIDYHQRVAKDGVAYKDVPKDSVTGNMVTVALSQEQRVSHLDKAAGIDEIIGYITRMTADTSK